MFSRQRLNRFPIVAIVISALALGAGCNRADTPTDRGILQVDDAWVRAPIPGQDKTAGYFTASNTGSEDVALTAARSDAARAIEIHTILRDGDMVRMRRLDEVVIGAGETVRFEPGGRHLMLFGVSELETSVDIVLEQSDGTEIPVRFRVAAVGET
ncbi:MAG: copper chaperone PCu(A)C [Pseudomonadales bacterium]